MTWYTPPEEDDYGGFRGRARESTAVFLNTVRTLAAGYVADVLSIMSPSLKLPPERIIGVQIAWEDDRGQVQTTQFSLRKFKDLTNAR